MLDLRYVKKLVEMLDDSSLDSIEISTEKGLKIRISKAASHGHAAPVAGQQAVPVGVAVAVPVPTTSAPQQPVVGVAMPVDPAVAAMVASTLTDIKSPMVGTYYGAAEPGGKPFVSVGSHIAKGQVLCIIEAMKIMNEIESEHAGVVKEVGATDAHPVEFGQVLFRIDTTSGHTVQDAR
ncbi:acetyl-CoA carboxylase biotin carboxyl carrier protein subunit [Gemmatimonadota bacterium]|nr:acetyl-CoA carboxylase biotin carboxyl carrier protein subunit [Gemmatimonadota bacterium]